VEALETSTRYNVPMTWVSRRLAKALSTNLSMLDQSLISLSEFVPMPGWNTVFSIVVSLKQKSAFADLILDHLLALIVRVVLEHIEEPYDVRILQARFSD
jgi:hypothetical protein